MYTKEDFLQAIKDTAQNFPLLAVLSKASDPRVLQSQGSIATMFSMLSQQIELAAMETFTMARDATVLADAALRGLAPLGTAARLRLAVFNGNASTYELAAGRILLDSGGHPYRLDTPISVPAGETAFCDVVQEEVTEIRHTVGQSSPFYRIPIPDPESDMVLCGVAIEDASARTFEFARRFTNIAPYDRVFHVEMDEYRKMSAVFGYESIVGYQPAAGEVLVVTLRHSFGDVRPDAGSPFALEYSYSVQDGQVKITMDSVLVPGESPMSVSLLRDLVKYPSVYDENAVFLGEFEYLVRKEMPSLAFLSVWNESVEELVRGPSEMNINRLFVSFDPAEGVSRASVEIEIRSIIARADDSYRVVFVPPVVVPIRVSVRARVSRVHDGEAVRAQIRRIALEEYGAQAPAARRGMLRPQYKRVYELLRANVPALHSEEADFEVSISVGDGLPQVPEQRAYVAEGDITIDLIPADLRSSAAWGRQ